MDITAVESSTLAKVGYEADRRLLQLEFRSGAVYDYFGVPASVHESLLLSSSKGYYFNRLVRGRFPYSRSTELRVQDG
jgi:hypothetical protein